MKKVKPTAIIVGASSGIGKALTHQLHKDGYKLGVAARRMELLLSLNDELGSSLVCKKMDITNSVESQKTLVEMASELGPVSLIIVCSGTGEINENLDWEKEQPTIVTNVEGFAAIAVAATNLFLSQGFGHLVGISSIAALRGAGAAPAYNASKAFVANYLEGLRIKVSKTKKPIFVTDIRPGFVDTNMAKGDGLFWVAPVEKAARQIITAINKKRKVAYISRRWRLIAWLLKLLPDFIYYRM